VKDNPEPANTLSGVERTVRVLKAVEAAGSTNLADIARRTGLNEATALRYLHSLTNLGFIERFDNTQYRLGWEVFRLGQHAISGRVPRETVRPTMEELLSEFNETVNFAMIKGDAVVIIDVLESRRGVKKANVVGQHDPWHASALGKCLLASMSDAEWRNIVGTAALPAFTSQTLTSVDDLADEIAQTRRRGYAIDNEEADEELCCVAAAVPAGPGQTPEYALSVSFVTHRLAPDSLAHAGQRVREAADRIGAKLR
jgi:IclR family acetate operon transcriptional repressor